MTAELLWIGNAENPKTGNVPTAYIGTNKTEAWDSCEGCALRESKDCYAWFGSVRMGQASMFRGYALNPSRYTFKAAMANRSPSARMVRVGAIGDPARASHKTIKSIAKRVQALGMAFVGYTHHWREKRNSGLKLFLMASCDNIAQADEAVKAGWRATAIVPWNFAEKRFITPGGTQAIVCPAQTKPGEITCNACRLCDASRETPFRVIAFKSHGPKERKKIYNARRLPTV
jgi:hypothetical protein